MIELCNGGEQRIDLIYRADYLLIERICLCGKLRCGTVKRLSQRIGRAQNAFP